MLAPSPGGPAEAAGVRAGEVLQAVGGTPVSGLSLYEVSDLLQGEAGSQVELQLRGPGQPARSAAARTLTLTRQRVQINPVTSTTCSGVPAAALPPGVLLRSECTAVRRAT